MRTFILFCAVLLSQTSLAAPYRGAINSSTAGAGRAVAEASESPFANPATLPFVRGYIFTSSYSTLNQPVGNALALTVTDNLPTTVIATSFAFTQEVHNKTDDAPESKLQNFRLSMGKNIFKQLSFGGALKYQNFQDTQNMRGHGTNGDIGFLWSPNDSLGVGLLSENIVDQNSSLPALYELEQQHSLALSYNYRRVIRMKADLVSDSHQGFARPTFLTGVETYLQKWVVMRLGVGRNFETKSDIYGVGLGFSGPRLAAHYAFEREQDSVKHSIDLTLPVW